MKYRDYRPTMFDSVGLNLDDRQNWIVCPTGQNRDSSHAEQSNLVAAVKILGGESETVEVHRFGHWAHGWFEIILVHPSRESEVIAIIERLKECPVLDQDDYTHRQWESAYELWASLPLQERIKLCAEEGISIFAARHGRIPEAIDISILAGE